MNESSIFVFMQYCPASLGEQIVQIPFFRFLRERYPEDRIVAVTPDRSGQVIEHLGLVDDMHVYPIENDISRLRQIVSTLHATRCRVAFQHRRKSVRTTLAARLSTRAPIVGFRGGVNFLFQKRSYEFDRGRYIAESYAQLLGRRLSECARRDRGDEERVVFVPGGLIELKKYPLEKYLEIARTLGRPVLFVLGPDMDRERETIAAARDDSAIRVAPSMVDLERILRDAALVIANDCGPAHFAHIHDVPRISVFDCSINHAHWFHAGANGRLVLSPRPGAIGEIPTGRVVDLAREMLESR